VADDNLVHAVALPPEAAPPIRVYVNGEERREGEDFVVEGAHLRFLRPLRARPPLGLRRKVMLAMGIGVYGDLKGDTLDVLYQAAGATRTVSIPLSAVGTATGLPPAA
jgi:hypothetical protein